MKKRLVSLLLIMTMVMMLFAGCGSKSSGEKTKKERGKAKDASAAVEQLADFESYDFTIAAKGAGEKVNLTYKVRRNGIALSFDGNVAGQKLKFEDIISIIDDNVYFDMSQIYDYADDMGAAESEGIDVVKKICGDYIVMESPQGFDLSDVAVEWADIPKALLVAMLENGDCDDDTITISSDNIEDVYDGIKKVIKKDVGDALDDTINEALDIDYVATIESYIDDMIDSVDAFKDLGLPGMDFSGNDLDEIIDQLYDELYDEFGTDDPDEINDAIGEMLEDATGNIMDEFEYFVDEAFDEVDFDEELEDVELEVTADDGVFTAEASVNEGGEKISLSFTVTENDSKLSKPSGEEGLGGAVALIGILAPSYLTYVEKSSILTDISYLYDIFITAENIACDVEYDLYAEDEFVVTIEDGYAYLDMHTYDNAALEAWQEYSGVGSYYEFKSKEGQYLSNTYVGVIQTDGSVDWYYGVYDDFMSYDYSFGSRFIGSLYGY